MKNSDSFLLIVLILATPIYFWFFYEHNPRLKNDRDICKVEAQEMLQYPVKIIKIDHDNSGLHCLVVPQTDDNTILFAPFWILTEYYIETDGIYTIKLSDNYKFHGCKPRFNGWLDFYEKLESN